MRIFTNEELKEVLKNLDNGVVYSIISRKGYGAGEIWADKTFIRWSHRGKSAVKKNIAYLRWFLQILCRDDIDIDVAVYSEYHMGYIPTSEQYKAIDHSMSHPNVLGK